MAFAKSTQARHPLFPAETGAFTTLQTSLHAADRTVAPPRFDSDLSTGPGGFATGDPGVSPGRTSTGWLPRACRPVTPWPLLPAHGVRAAGRTWIQAEGDRVERGGWTVDEAVRFLAHATARADRDLELWETLIGTGLRKGECLALRWDDLDLEHRVLHVRQTLSSIDNSRLVFTTPKTRGSAAGVGLSRRVIDALYRQRLRQTSERTRWGTAYQDHDLVFARENGLPLRPEYVLRRFRSLRPPEVAR